MPINILIVEDEFLVAHDIKKQLQIKGYNVVDIVSSCKDTLKALKSNEFDLILMDIVIKGEKDGIETAILIKKNTIFQ